MAKSCQTRNGHRWYKQLKLGKDKRTFELSSLDPGVIIQNRLNVITIMIDWQHLNLIWIQLWFRGPHSTYYCLQTMIQNIHSVTWLSWKEETELGVLKLLMTFQFKSPDFLDIEQCGGNGCCCACKIGLMQNVPLKWPLVLAEIMIVRIWFCGRGKGKNKKKQRRKIHNIFL